MNTNYALSISAKWEYKNDSEREIPEHIQKQLDNTTKEYIEEHSNLNNAYMSVAMDEFLLVSEDDEEYTDFKGVLTIELKLLEEAA